jgi:hypothetical protein
MHALAAFCGVQNLIWPHVWVGIWGIRFVSLVVAGFAGWAVYRKVFQWRRARLALAIVLSCALVIAGPFVAFFLLLLPINANSDVGLVSGQMVNSRLPKCMHLPQSARDVHLWYVGWINPGVVLRFTAEEREARAYVQGVTEYIAARPEGRTYTGPKAARDGEYMAPQPTPPFKLHGRPWWRPQEDRPWRYFLAPRGNETMFIQLAADERTVYLYRSVE